MSEYDPETSYMDTARLETLVDGIFAIAMTLLVLTLVVPDLSGQLSNAALTNALVNLLPNFIAVFVSFLLLAIFWKIHHRTFKQIDHMDGILLWINVIWLLFIVMVPFSSTLTGDYGQFPVSHIFFNINMLGIAVLLYINWAYAAHKKFIHEKITQEQINFTKKINTVFIIVVLIAIGLSHLIPQYAEVVYLILLPIDSIVKRL